MNPSTDEDLDHLPHVIIISDVNDIWSPSVLDHSIDIENDIYHLAMDSNISEDGFASFGRTSSLIALFNAASSPDEKVLFLCIDFSPRNGYHQKMSLKRLSGRIDPPRMLT